jgi:limonene-1,2-epoxide hydrolase
MSTPAETVEKFVAAFIAAWPDGDAAGPASFFSEDAVYHNGPMEPIRGRQAIQAALGAFMGMGGEVGVDIVNTLADGAIVMTERVDRFMGTEKTISLPVMGVFEVHLGAITAWRDYFDLNQFTSQIPDGV